LPSEEADDPQKSFFASFPFVNLCFNPFQLRDA
jgi:hypothetical protein